MHRTFLALSLAAIPFAPLAAFAHEGHVHHLKGTVASVSQDGKTLEVKEKKDSTTRVTLTAETKILMGEKAIAARDLPVGARIVVSLKETAGGPSTALEVRVAESGAHSEPAAYGCPMHLEVRASAPGKCPKCGMNLRKEG